MPDQSSDVLPRHLTGPTIKIWMAGIALLVLLLSIYGNSFHASWQYDDFGNIVHNSKVHMDRWSWDQLKQSLSAGLDFQTISRPLAYVSFAINHRLGGLKVFGYHLVNFCIHGITSIFLFLFIHSALKLPLLKNGYDRHATAIGAVAVLFWATHPIQVTAVTYVVQRMASLAGMFYIMAMYLYLKGRTAAGSKSRALFFLLCGLVVVCALLTKENTLVIGYAILLFDLLCIQGVDKRSVIGALVKSALITLAATAVALVYTSLNFKGLVASYDIRPFTMIERVMTQPRVLFLYLSLIAVPMTSRMTLLHDIRISHSLTDPWTTLLAVMGLLMAVIALGLSARKFPLISFCGFFFLLNHAMEASILNLELIYEHRNYIPTMLIFIPPAMALVKGISFFNYRRSFQYMLGGAAIVLLLSNCYTTFAYNRYFESEYALWRHAVQRSPGLSLAHNNLGNVYWDNGDRSLAYTEFKHALLLNRYNNLFHKALVYHNNGLYAAVEQKDYKQALWFFRQARSFYKGNPKIWYQLARSEVALGDLGGARQDVQKAMAQWPDDADLLYLKALILIKQDKFHEAEKAARCAVDIDNEHANAMAVLAEANRKMGDLKKAAEIWEKFLTLEPRNLYGLLALIELHGSEHDDAAARAYLSRLIKLSGRKSLDEVIEISNQDQELLAYRPDWDVLRDAIGALGGWPHAF